MKKASLHNLGCKVNSYETEAMEQLLKNAGYEIVEFGKEAADVYIINTCSVTNIADRKSRQMLHKAKKMNPRAIVIAAGCYVQTEGVNLQEDEAVDIIIGNNKKSDILEIIDQYLAERGKRQAVIDIGNSKEYEELFIESVTEHTRAYIKVQDGCNQFCSYCIIPYVRGRVRSRKLESAVDEVKRLAAKGYKEIVLTGIHLSSYGADLENMNLQKLIKELHNIEGLERIRLGSLEPGIITEEFVSTVASLKKVCPHFHLSLQSGCDATLKRMNRKYDTEEYYEKCILLRKYYVDPAITTDIIVGFPGETEEEFEITRKFIEKARFFEMHVFKYSKRKGTAAEVMNNQVQEQVKAERSKELIRIAQEMSNEYTDKFIGKTVSVLFEEVVEADGICYASGHTSRYMKVMVRMEENTPETDVINQTANIQLAENMGDGNVLGIRLA